MDTMEVPPSVGSSGSVFTKHGQKNCYLGKNISAGDIAIGNCGKGP